MFHLYLWDGHLTLTLNQTASNAIQVQVDAQGNIQYDAVVRQGHDGNRIIHTSIKDLVPLRQRADVGEINLDRPDEVQVNDTAERTRQALEKIAMNQIAASQPKNIAKTGNKSEPTYIRYTPANQMGQRGDVAHNQRIIKMVNRQEDPMEPAKFRHRKLPRPPASPPPPIMHSPPRKVTAKEQADWIIPPSISNWKNPKGYTIPLDKRMAAKGNHVTDVKVNDNFAKFSEALFTAERAAREEVDARARIQAQLGAKEREEKEQSLRTLAEKAREERLVTNTPPFFYANPVNLLDYARRLATDEIHVQTNPKNPPTTQAPPLKIPTLKKEHENVKPYVKSEIGKCVVNFV
jgi:SNW domain-containing protein 1